MDFDSIIGQTEVISALKNSISSDRVGHAYIFTGPKGIGKRTVARAFSSMLLCENCKDNGNCNECLCCRLFKDGTNPDFCIIEPEGASIKIEEIRVIQSDIIVKPLYSKRKVYIISEADLMTTQAQNCLLKVLEEPPGYAVIILTTTNSNSLLETIRSRAIKVNFKKNTLDEVKSYLISKIGRNDSSIDFISTYADGIIGAAAQLSDSEEFISIREKTIDLVIKIASGAKLTGILEHVDFFESNRNNIDIILDIMLLIYRDMLLLKKTGNEKILINSDKKDIILKNLPNLTTEKLLVNMEVIEATRREIKQNANYQLSIEVMLIKLQEE